MKGGICENVAQDMAYHISLTSPKEASKWKVREENEVVKVLGRCSAYNQEVQCIKPIRAINITGK